MKSGLPKSTVVFLMGMLAVLLCVQPGISAQTDTGRYPNRPITFIVPVSAGSVGGDLVSRLLCKQAERFLGQPIVVVNKTGGSFAVGVAAIAAAKPDGYTIGYPTPASLFITPFLQKLPYRPLEDFQPIIQFGETPFGVIVRNDSPLKSFDDIIAYARENPKKMTYGTGGAYSSAHLALERIARREGVQLVHIPFKGGSEIQTALLGGHIQAAAGDVNYALVEAGQIRPVLLLSEARHGEYRQIPNLKDIGYDLPYPAMNSVIGPKGLPEGVLTKLEESFARAMKEPDFIKGMKEFHFSIVHRNSKELSEYFSRSYNVFQKVMNEAKPN